MPKTGTLAIGYPHNGSVRHCFMDSINRFRSFDAQKARICGALIPGEGLYIAGVRNKIVRDFLTTDLEWLLFIDTDQIFVPEVPYLLIQSAEEVRARVMSALYFGFLGAGNASPMWWQKMPDGQLATVGEITEGIQEIHGFGTGMVLLHRTLFEEMAPLHPDDSWKWFSHDLTEFNGKLERWGEDLSFCVRLADMGVKMYGDSRINIGHQKTINLDYEMFMKLVKQREPGKEPESMIIVDPVV